MTSIGPADAPRCGWDIRHWALGTSGGNVLYWLLATGLAGWAWYKIGEKEEAIAAEMAAVSISLFDAPKLVAITLTAFFAILAILCLISVVLLASSHPTAQRKRLKGFCIGTLAFAVFVLAWCSAGLILSLGTERKKEIEEACKSIDTKCYSGYLGIVAGSGIVEAIGFLNLGWMLAAIYKYRNHLESGGLDVQNEEAAMPLKKGDPATTMSLGRRRSSRHGSGSSGKKSSRRRSDYGDSYSMSKSHRRSSSYTAGYGQYANDIWDDIHPRGRSHSRTRSSTGRGRSESRHSLREMERAVEQEWAERSLSRSSRRRGERSGSRSGRVRSASRARRGSGSSASSSSEEEDGGGRGRYRSMGKAGRERSRSRSGRGYESDDSLEGRKGRGRSKSRSMSRSRSRW